MLSLPVRPASRAVLGAFVVGAAALCGCSKAPPPLQYAPAEGVVTIGGKPAAGILVQFMPQVALNAPGPTSTGQTDDNGKFKLISTDGKDGALVGKHKVILADMQEERPPQGKPVTKPPRIPTHYMIPGPNTPEVTVEAENNKPFEIAVK
jgi:hypothetical protein